MSQSVDEPGEDDGWSVIVFQIPIPSFFNSTRYFIVASFISSCFCFLFLILFLRNRGGREMILVANDYLLIIEITVEILL